MHLCTWLAVLHWSALILARRRSTLSTKKRKRMLICITKICHYSSFFVIPSSLNPKSAQKQMLKFIQIFSKNLRNISCWAIKFLLVKLTPRMIMPLSRFGKFTKQGINSIYIGCRNPFQIDCDASRAKFVNKQNKINFPKFNSTIGSKHFN